MSGRSEAQRVLDSVRVAWAHDTTERWHTEPSAETVDTDRSRRGNPAHARAHLGTAGRMSTSEVRCLGVDLAWSEHAGSGVCALSESGDILDEGQLAPDALAAWVRRWRGQRSVLAIDGPLVVPPDSAALRPVERELHHRYGRYHAGPFPGGAASTIMRGRARAPAAALLDAVGDYVVGPTDRTSAHRAIEVFPAPTWIELFGLSERVVYKRGRLAERVVALARLRGFLASLADADPPLRAPSPSGLVPLVEAARNARDWKAVEDVIDARLCAYVALLWDRVGEPAWAVTGEADWHAGYVVVPVGRAQRTLRAE
jgi:predicted RNase H-like nuclease